MYAWLQLARTTASPGEREGYLEQTIAEVRDMLEDQESSDRRRNLADRARWAAEQLGDEEAVGEFETVIAQNSGE